MKRIEFEIEGIVPILFNRFTEKNQDYLIKRSSGKKKSVEESREEAMEKVYRTGNGDIGIPALNLRKSILNGCRMAKLKFGKGSAEPYLRAIMFISPEILQLDRKNPDGIHECAGNIPPGPKGHKAMIRRPYCEAGWKFKGIIELVDSRIDKTIIEESLKEAGMLVGLCDHRPEYGRFKVLKFEECK
jgi:hypothetical protein